MTINLQQNKEEFESLVRQYVKRDGVEKVLAWLEKTDFFTAPASTKYHLSVEGGLCQHSLNVFHEMVKLAKMYCEVYEGEEETVFDHADPDVEGAFTMENIAVTALFHDICKANCYVRDFKNVKVNGKWEQQEYWKWEEQFVYGHGTKSVYILQQFMRMGIDEAQAIRFHMAGREDPLSDQYERIFSQVFDNSKLAVLLYLADSVACWIDEKEEV